MIMAPGDMTANTPIDCMLEDSDIAVTLLYVIPGRPLPAPLPDHDLAFIAIGESLENQVLLRQLDGLSKLSAKPVINNPERIRSLTRDQVSDQLKAVAGIVMPSTVQVSRETLLRVRQQELSLDAIISGGQFPIVARPTDSHGGKDLVRLDRTDDLSAYVDRVADEAFYISPFIDYRSTDGLSRSTGFCCSTDIPLLATWQFRRIGWSIISMRT